MAANYVLLEKITVGATQAGSVTFSNIPQTGYTDLLIRYSVRGSAASGDVRIEFNGSGGTAYSGRLLYGDGASVASASATGQAYWTWGGFINRDGTTANTFASNDVYIPNYTSSNFKSGSVDMAEESNSSAPVYSGMGANLWSSTAAITSIKLTPASGNFVQYSTFYLYGVAKLGTTPAIVPYATGGDTIMTDGTYWYHAFKSSGTFTPTKTLSCDVLTVAGGGAGGSSQAGAYYVGTGGGAGGVYYSTANSVSSAATVTVGAGGASKLQVYDFSGNNGSNSQFGSLTAAVGGGGGVYFGVTGTGKSGGSGGGGGGQNSTPTPGAGTSGQGYAGGVGLYSGGGGGGAGAVGGNSNWPTDNYTPGTGGVGTSAYSSWGLATGTGQLVSGTYYYAGGGGGGFSDAYGTPANYNNVSSGGGGRGGSGGISSPSGQYAQSAGAGVANTGGGGGGGGSNGNTAYSGGFNSANGGSGIVIVRYAV